ncbi:MAG: trigger factor [Alphaproteobacteria bacterium]|nr:trigger factor [Alphaproteobacteria bacterium]
MQVEEVKNEGLSREYTITIPANELDAKRDEKLKEYARTIRMPGFRPGKVPLNILRQRYGKAVLGEILEKAVNDSSMKVMKDKGVTPALQPKIEVKEFDEGKDLVYSMAVEVLPEFEVGDFKNLKLEKPVAKASDKEIGEALSRIASQRKSSTKVEESRASKKGDIAVIDFKGRTADDNREHPGMATDGHYLELGSGQFIPGFEEQLVGRKVGEKVEVKVTFPEQYQPELAGRDAIFDVEIKELRAVKEAEADDQLATDLGFEGLQALKDAVKEQIENEYSQFSRMKVKRALLDILDENNKFAVPPGMLDLEYESIVRQVEAESHQNHDHGPDEACEHDHTLSDEDKAELREIADRRVRLGLVLSKIGNENNIQVSDKELQRAVIQEAQRYPGQEKMVFDYFQKNRQALEGLRAPLFENKVVDYILELADVKEIEVTPEELQKEGEEPEEKAVKKASENKVSKAKSGKSESGDAKKDRKPKSGGSKAKADNASQAGPAENKAEKPEGKSGGANKASGSKKASGKK